jgi:hypothetical protein
MLKSYEYQTTSPPRRFKSKLDFKAILEKEFEEKLNIQDKYAERMRSSSSSSASHSVSNLDLDQMFPETSTQSSAESYFSNPLLVSPTITISAPLTPMLTRLARRSFSMVVRRQSVNMSKKERPTSIAIIKQTPGASSGPTECKVNSTILKTSDEKRLQRKRFDFMKPTASKKKSHDEALHFFRIVHATRELVNSRPASKN